MDVPKDRLTEENEGVLVPEELAERIALLDGVAFFGGLTEPARALVAKSMQREKYALGSKMFSFGEIGDKLFVVASGKVRISRNVSGMGEEALAVLGPGQVFGEMSLFDEAPRSADAIVHESCEVLTITRAAFDELLFLHKGLAYEVLWNAVKILSSRLRETNDKLTFLSMSQKF